MRVSRYFYGGMLVLLVVCVFLAGSWYGRRDVSKETSATGRRILYYVDPMNPTHTSDKPGIAPCGMKMEPVYADEPTGFAIAGVPSAMPAGTVRVSAEKQQLMGLKLATVEKQAGAQTIRLLGRVAPDETRTYRINAATDIWVRKVFPPTTGSLVKKDEPLMAYYTSAFLAAANAYLYALDTQDRHKQSADVSQAQAQNLDFQMRQAVGNLLNMGVSESQMKEMAKTRKASDLVEVRSPSEGFILARSVSPGQFVSVGNELYRIADLSRVWVAADLFQNEAEYVKPGIKVKVVQPQQKKEFYATASNVLPQFDPNSRTLKVRLELDNPDYLLKPDMFVDVEFSVRLPAALSVPVDALIDTGTKKTVFVDRGNGFFEPRQVETGWRVGDRIEITKGLMQGERIVISGTFLIDSESRMRMAAAGMQAAQAQQAARAKDLVCGMEVDQGVAKAAGFTSEYEGKTYYFCMAECRDAFQKKPEQDVQDGGQLPVASGQKKTETRPQGKAKVSEESHSHASPGQEHETVNRTEKPTANDTMGAHVPVHTPTR